MTPWRTAALVVVVLAVASCAGGEEAGSSPHTGDPGVVHVHGLGVDPADGTLYAATHTGLFKVTGDSAQRVGRNYHDLMGFTAVDHDDFIASGHPDVMGDDLQLPNKPPLLGLVHSDDQGQSWQPVSLLGRVDFHSLEAAHGKVYGWDSTSGRFMVSGNRRTWQNRSIIALLDFAVSPTDPELILAATQSGIMRSTDGGRSWAKTSPQPALVIDWANNGPPVVATPHGQVLAGDAAGGRWEMHGDLGGQPEALLAQGGALYAAVAERGLLQSDDGGVTWAVRLHT